MFKSCRNSKGHAEEVSVLSSVLIVYHSQSGASARLAMACGLDQSEVDLIRLAAPMHDVGKIGIPDSVLRKPGPLTPEERRRDHRRDARTC